MACLIQLSYYPQMSARAHYLHPQARLRVVHADPAEVERLRTLHQVPRCQRNRRPWLKDQTAIMNIEEEQGADDDADEPRIWSVRSGMITRIPRRRDRDRIARLEYALSAGARPGRVQRHHLVRRYQQRGQHRTLLRGTGLDGTVLSRNRV